MLVPLRASTCAEDHCVLTIALALQLAIEFDRAEEIAFLDRLT